MRERISACITAGNEEENIRRCLESITWADEIVVVDSFSGDRTVEICREYTDKVYQHEWLGYIGQKKLAADMAEGPWILFIDADEEISRELSDEIRQEFDSGESTLYVGYKFPRMVRYLGRWIRHGIWYPDIKLRLYKKAFGLPSGTEPHDRITVDGAVKQLTGNMYHYTYENIEAQIARINTFSTISAASQIEDGTRFHLFNLLLRPPLRFLRGYFFKGGFLDGLPGLIIAVNTSFAVFAKYAKLWDSYRKVAKAEAKRVEDTRVAGTE